VNYLLECTDVVTERGNLVDVGESALPQLDAQLQLAHRYILRESEPLFASLAQRAGSRQLEFEELSEASAALTTLSALAGRSTDGAITEDAKRVLGSVQYARFRSARFDPSAMDLNGLSRAIHSQLEFLLASRVANQGGNDPLMVPIRDQEAELAALCDEALSRNHRGGPGESNDFSTCPRQAELLRDLTSSALLLDRLDSPQGRELAARTRAITLAAVGLSWSALRVRMRGFLHSSAKGVGSQAEDGHEESWIKAQADVGYCVGVLRRRNPRGLLLTRFMIRKYLDRSLRRSIIPASSLTGWVQLTRPTDSELAHLPGTLLARLELCSGERSCRRFLGSPTFQVAFQALTSRQSRSRDRSAGGFTRGKTGGVTIGATAEAVATLLAAKVRLDMRRDGEPAVDLTLRQPGLLPLPPQVLSTYWRIGFPFRFELGQSFAWASLFTSLMVIAAGMATINRTRTTGSAFAWLLLSAVIIALIPGLRFVTGIRQRRAIAADMAPDAKGTSALHEAQVSAASEYVKSFTPDSVDARQALSSGNDSDIADPLFALRFCLLGPQVMVNDKAHERVIAAATSSTFSIDRQAVEYSTSIDTAMSILLAMYGDGDARTASLAEGALDIRLTRLMDLQESGDSRTGGWGINAGDSRASVYATSLAVIALTSICDDGSTAANSCRTELGRCNQEIITRAKDGLKSGVDYLRRDLRSKLNLLSDATYSDSVETYRIAWPVLALSTRARFRGKHGGDEPYIRKAVEWLEEQLVDVGGHSFEDQLLVRTCGRGGSEGADQYREFIIKHSVPGLALRAVLMGNASLLGSSLQSQLGSIGTTRRPLTAPVFEAPVETGMIRLYKNAQQRRPTLSDQIAFLEAASAYDDYQKHGVLAGDAWAEYCRRSKFRSARPLPTWIRSAKVVDLDITRSWMEANVPAILVNASVLVSVALAPWLARWLGDAGRTSNSMPAPTIRLLQLSLSAPIILLVAEVAQFFVKPQRFRTSLGWATGAFVAMVSICASFPLVFHG